MISYLKVFHVWKRNTYGYNRTGIRITEIQAFTNFSSADSYEESSILNKPEKNTWIIPSCNVSIRRLTNTF